MLIVFQIPYITVIETKLCRQQAQVIENNVAAHIPNIGGKAQHKRYKRLRLCGGQAYD
jgi:hypothetical protein